MAFLCFRSMYCILEKDMNTDQRFAFSAVCISTAALSTYGACVQLKSWYSHLKDSELRRKPSSNPVIVFCLALADLFTCMGVIAMAILIMTMNPPYQLNISVPQYGKVLNMTLPSKTWYKYIGVPIESFTMFSYISSYLWTFGYALDICLQIYDKDSWVRMRAYLFCFWVVPIWMVVWGQFGFLTGSMKYCSIRSQEILHYMVCYVPLVCVFTALPFIYMLAYKRVRRNVKFAHACYTNAERELLSGVKKKFLLIWLVFVFCWITNVIDGFMDLQIIWTNVHTPYIEESPIKFPHVRVHYEIWMIEALVNPLQGFLNCLVYGQAKKMAQCCRKCCQCPPSKGFFSEGYTTTSDSNETFLINSNDNLVHAPMIQGSRNHSSSNTREGIPNSEKKRQFVARLLGEPRIS